tara:strand:- start:1317 stop:2006 length:690 start_codon:yes stop_codon:yes gene_type:complete
MKLYESKKLHYNKYLYKLCIRNQCATFFRTEFQKEGTLSYAKGKLDECNRYHNFRKPQITLPVGSRFKESIDTKHYYDAITIYRHLIRNDVDYLVRVEMHRLNLYSNDRKFLTSLSNNIKENWVEFYEPDPLQIQFLQENKNVILVDKEPQYQYKVTLGKKLGTPSLVKWIDENPHLAKIGDKAKESITNSRYVKGYYFYVRDAKTLLIAQMLVGDNIQRIEQLVFTDK